MTHPRQVRALATGLILFLAAAGSGTPATGPTETRSASGQFVVSTAPGNSPIPRRSPEVSTNTEILRLAAPWLVVSAERFKVALGRGLGQPADVPWGGKIFIVLHPAQSLDEPVVIAAWPFMRVLDYRVDMPDLITRARYGRALAAVLLLEMANRDAPVTGHSAEVPAWLVDGLSRQIIDSDNANVILSAPNKAVDSLSVTKSGIAMMPEGITLARSSQNQRGLDPLAAARRVLQNSPALTFDQLSWPEDAQLEGGDGGVYPASAQLFVDELLALENGPAKLRALLIQLPACQNWQSAFFAAFHDNFRTPLDVEKWWALRVFAFAAHAPGPQWTLAASRSQLDAVLAVPVEIRTASNSLPTRADISLQAAIRSFEPPRQTAIVETKLRDLELVQLRLAPALAPVAAGYRAALADFLGEGKQALARPADRHEPVRRVQADTGALLKKLDALDARRREDVARFDSKSPRPPGN